MFAKLLRLLDRLNIATVPRHLRGGERLYPTPPPPERLHWQHRDGRLHVLDPADKWSAPIVVEVDLPPVYATRMLRP